MFARFTGKHRLINTQICDDANGFMLIMAIDSLQECQNHTSWRMTVFNPVQDYPNERLVIPGSPTIHSKVKNARLILEHTQFNIQPCSSSNSTHLQTLLDPSLVARMQRNDILLCRLAGRQATGVNGVCIL